MARRVLRQGGDVRVDGHGGERYPACGGSGGSGPSDASAAWVAIAATITLGLLLTAVLGAVLRRGPARAFWLGFALFGWLADAPADLVEWRRLAVAGVSHDYARRVGLVVAIPDAVMRQRPDEIRARLSGWRQLLGLDPSA